MLIDLFDKKKCDNCGKLIRDLTRIQIKSYNICSSDCMMEILKNELNNIVYKNFEILRENLK